MLKKKFAIAAVLGLAGALSLATCGEPVVKDVNGDGVDDGEPVTSVIAPSNPTGTVTGMVLDAATGVPFPEGRSFTVQLVAGGLGGGSLGTEQAISDGSGQFRFADVPAGIGVTVVVTAEGYAAAYAQVVLNAAVGNFPSDNAHVAVAPIELIELSGSMRAMVLGPDGRPLAGVDLHLDTDFAFFLGGNAQGRVHATATTDADGMASFTDIPAAAQLAYRIATRSYVITVPPPDIDGDDVPDYNGALRTVTVAAAAVQVAPVTIVVGFPTGSTPLRVLASNIADLVNPSGSTPAPVPLPSVLPKTGNVTLAFNQPVDPDSFLMRLVAETGGAFIPVGGGIEVFNSYHNVAVVPLPETLQAGQEYNLFVEARPALSGDGGAYRGAVAFFVEPAEAEVSVLSFWHEERTNNGIIDGGDYIWFQLNVPVGARQDDGSPAGSALLLPIRVQLSNTEVGDVGQDLPIEQGYTGEALAPSANLIEELPEGGQYVASGFTTLLRLTLPAGVVINTGTVTWHFEFNDPVGASASQSYRVATPQGVLPVLAARTNNLTLDPDAPVDN